MQDGRATVVVVGAGVAGLTAANRLRQLGIDDVLVVEAADHVGGRIKQVEGVLPWPVELGPEFVHGAKSTLKTILEEIGCQLREFAWPDRWYYGKQQRMTDASVTDPSLERLHATMERIGDVPKPPAGQDESAAHWLSRQPGIDATAIAAADACYANDFGCGLHQLGVTEMIIENSRWDSGETYLIPDRSLRAVVGHLSKGLRIRTGWPVAGIEYTAGGALLRGPAGSVLRCRYAVVTVSLRMLQLNVPCFSPPLPRATALAVQRLRMSNAIKVILAFARPIWPEGFFDVVCLDCFVPEFWVTTYQPTTPNGAALHGITGFLAGAAAEVASALSPEEILQRTLTQLDSMFGTQEHPRPATKHMVKWHVVDWSKEPFVRGAYSYPSFGAHEGDREALAMPIKNTIFLAGEATHPAVNPCIQAAIETGHRAAEQVATDIQQRAAKL